MSVFIYALVCPTKNCVRYIGKSIDPEKRFKDHITQSAEKWGDCHRSRWLRRLTANGLKPSLKILHEVPDNLSWQDAEKFFIASARALGLPITNGTLGGDGVDMSCPETQARRIEGLKLANLRPGVKERRAAAIKATLARPEVREARSLALKAAQKRPDVKARKSQIMIARRADPKTQERYAERMREVMADPVTREKRLSAMFVGRSNPEIKAQVAAKTKAMWADPEKRTRILESMRLSVANDPGIHVRRNAGLKAAYDNNPERKAGRSKQFKSMWADPTFKARMSAIHRETWARRKREAAKQSEGAV